MDVFHALELLNLIFRQVKCSKNWKTFEALNLRNIVCAQVELFDPYISQVLYSCNLVTGERQLAEALVVLEAFNFCDVVIVQEQGLEVLLSMHILNSNNLIARVVDPLQVGRCLEIEHVPQIVVTGVKLKEVSDGAESAQGCKIIS